MVVFLQNTNIVATHALVWPKAKWPWCFDPLTWTKWRHSTSLASLSDSPPPPDSVICLNTGMWAWFGCGLGLCYTHSMTTHRRPTQCCTFQWTCTLDPTGAEDWPYVTVSLSSGPENGVRDSCHLHPRNLWLLPLWEGSMKCLCVHLCVIILNIALLGIGPG